jgi:membrane protein
MVVFQLAFQGFTMASQYLIYDVIYGAFAALPIFLLWLYLVWVIALSGAVFARSLSLRGTVVRADEPLLIKAMRVLQMVAEAHRLGRPINESKVFSWINSDVYQQQRIFHALGELRLIGIDVHGE